MAGSNSRDDGQSAPAALQPLADRSVCRLVVALTKPIWVLECALMGKAIYEGVRGAAEFAERTKSNAFDFWHSIKRIGDSPAPASPKSGICCPGFGLVFCRNLVDSAVCSSDERGSVACFVEVI